MATTGELASIGEFTRALYRLLGTGSDDEALVENGEAADDVAYLALTRGVRSAQRWMIAEGAGDRWRKRSAAISTWYGSDAADGGRYINLATGNAPSPIASDFLRLDGNQTDRSALVEASGNQWGLEIPADEDAAQGDFYYLKGDQIWLARSASPPATLYLRYYYRHPAFTSGTTSFDFDMDARWLVVAEAAMVAVQEGWAPDPTAEGRVARALAKAQGEARRTLRRTREPRSMHGPTRFGGSPRY